MDFEKLKRDAQNQLDQRLAEVDRLTGIAKELEKKNAEAQAKHDELVETLTSDIDSLRAEKAFAEEDVEKVKEDIKYKQDELTSVSRDVVSLKSERQELDELREEKERELAIVEQTGAKDIQKLEDRIVEKRQEIESLASDFITTSQQNDKELAKQTKAIEKAQKELDVVTGAVEETNKTLSDTKKEVKSIMRDAESADHRAVLANEEVAKAEKRLGTLTQETETAEATLTSLKTEIETAQAELKPLLAKRIDSANYMKELEYKEANLRKKYEDVGLEYN